MKYLKVFTDFANRTRKLSDAEMGRLFRAMLEYASSCTEPELSGNERYLWDMAKEDIDRQISAYAEMCAINKQIAVSRYVTKRNATKRSVTKRNEASEEKDKEKEKEKEKDNITPLSPLEGAIGEFKAFRKSMKAPLTDLAEQKMRNELQRLAGDNDDMKIRIIDQSIRNGWKGVFPLKEEYRRNAANYEQHRANDDELKHLLVNLDG